jgi:LysM repeat protein
MAENAAVSGGRWYPPGMLVRRGTLMLLVAALATPARAETGGAAASGPSSGDQATAPALSTLRALLLHRLPGNPLRAPGSPRYLAVQDPAVRGTRLFVGWVLPGLAASALPDVRALTDALATALRARAAKPELRFYAAVSLDTDAEAPLVVVELSTERPAATRELEEALLDVVRSLGAVPPAGPGAPPKGSGRVAAVARARLGPLSRAVVEVHRRDAPAVARASEPRRHVIERGDTLSEIAEAHGLELEQLAKLNALDVHRPIRPGQALRLTGQRQPLPKVYVVQAGDSLAKVARRFGVSETSLVEANRLDDRSITQGQKLVLPR